MQSKGVLQPGAFKMKGSFWYINPLKAALGGNPPLLHVQGVRFPQRDPMRIVGFNVNVQGSNIDPRNNNSWSMLIGGVPF